MAVSQEITVVGVANITEGTKHAEKKCKGNNGKSVSDASSTCTTASSSSDSQCKQQRRRRRRCRRRGKKSKKSGQQLKQQTEELSFEEQCKYVALDCEMVGVGYNGTKSAVARVTMVGWNGDLVFDEFIIPTQEVTDYRTFVSGITKEDLDAAVMDLEICRERILDILGGKVLVGHALKNDMKALGISHPWYMTRDTAKYEPFMQVRFDDGVLWPRKLKQLAMEKLNRDIQTVGKPHSAYEDAVAAMDLYRTVRKKWEKIMDYKIKKTHEIEMMKHGKAIPR